MGSMRPVPSRARRKSPRKRELQPKEKNNRAALIEGVPSPSLLGPSAPPYLLSCAEAMEKMPSPCPQLERIGVQATERVQTRGRSNLHLSFPSFFFSLLFRQRAAALARSRSLRLRPRPPLTLFQLSSSSTLSPLFPFFLFPVFQHLHT